MTTAKVLDVIRNWDRPIPPSVRDVMRIAALSSTSIADYHLHILERKGYIQRTHDQTTNEIRARTIQLTAKGRGWATVEVVGTLDEKGIHKYHPSID